MGDPEAQREVAEGQEEYRRGEYITGEEAWRRVGLGPVGECGRQGVPGWFGIPVVGVPWGLGVGWTTGRRPDGCGSGVTGGGLPVRVPGGAIGGEGVERMEMIVDLEVLSRVIERLRRL
jgi:hypothetical protein